MVYPLPMVGAFSPLAELALSIKFGAGRSDRTVFCRLSSRASPPSFALASRRLARWLFGFFPSLPWWSSSLAGNYPVDLPIARQIFMAELVRSNRRDRRARSESSPAAGKSSGRPSYDIRLLGNGDVKFPTSEKPPVETWSPPITGSEQDRTTRASPSFFLCSSSWLRPPTATASWQQPTTRWQGTDVIDNIRIATLM